MVSIAAAAAMPTASGLLGLAYGEAHPYRHRLVGKRQRHALRNTDKSVVNRSMIDVCLSAWSFVIQPLRRRVVGVEVGDRPRYSPTSLPLGSDWRRAAVGPSAPRRTPASSAIAGCSPSGCSSPGASASAEAIAVKFSVCMRAHGLTDFPDPTVGSNGLPNWSGVDNLAPAYEAADKVCKQDLPDIGPHTSAEKATANAAALKYAVCMRSNGVPNFPDPNGQGVIQINNATGVPEPSSPAFQKAEAARKRLDNGFGESAATAVSPAPGGAGSGS